MPCAAPVTKAVVPLRSKREPSSPSYSRSAPLVPPISLRALSDRKLTERVLASVGFRVAIRGTLGKRALRHVTPAVLSSAEIMAARV